MNATNAMSSVMTPFGESPGGTAPQITSTTDNADFTEATTTSPDLVNEVISSVTQTLLKVSPQSELTTSAAYPRLGEAGNSKVWGDRVNNTLWGNTEESESHLVLILSIVTACGVLLVLVMMLGIVIACRLRRLGGTEPQLLTFSIPGETASSSDIHGIRGIINQAYDSDFTHFDSFTSTLDRKSPDGEILDNSDTESAYAAEMLNDVSITKPKDQRSSKGKASNPAVIKKSPITKIMTTTEKQGMGPQPEGKASTFHSENGISECVNPLYGKERSKPYINFPLESISEDDVENSDEDETSKRTSPEIHRHDSIILNDISTTFPDVDHKCLDNAPGINMAESVSSTQSCPNTPLMHPKGITILKSAHVANNKLAWASESNIKHRDDDRSFRGSDCVIKTPGPVEDADDLHGSWRGDLDETWEAKTSF